MSARKLSDTDKKAILEEYRQPGETTLTIANRYGVSNSTISRMLKSSLSPRDYEVLIQQKRSGRVHHSEPEMVFDAEPESPPCDEPELSYSADASRRIRKRSSAGQSPEVQLPDNEDSVQLDLQLTEVEKPILRTVNVERSTDLDDPQPEELEDEDEDDEDFDEDDEDFDEDEDDEDFDDGDLDFPITKRGTRILGQLQVLPFDGATLPKTCYIVVDRMAELITRPLKDFGDLGQIPPEEVQEKTLPVFDNHRVARRFANRSQRVTKVPDGKMLQRVKDYLQAKGITRILVDGQVYSL
jgi:hypothetical protein